jgi:hypothetical protein
LPQPFRGTSSTAYDASFVEWQPIAGADRLFDIGIVDANGDGRSTLHVQSSLRQALIADEHGAYRDVLGGGLDQSQEFRCGTVTRCAGHRQAWDYIYWFGAHSSSGMQIAEP